MTRVSQILQMSHQTTVYTVSPWTTVLEAVRLARSMNIGALPVLDEGDLVGIISERDFSFQVLAEMIDPSKVEVNDFMTPDPAYVTPFTDVLDCLNLMKEMKARHVPVLDKKNLVGIISMRDVLYALLKNQELLAQQFEAYITGAR